MNPDTEVAISIAKTPLKALRIALSKLTSPLSIPSKGIERIIIKPSIYNPDLVGNTRPETIHALAEIFSSIAPIIVVESDNPVRRTIQAFEKTGYTRQLSEIAELVDLSSEPALEVEMAGHAFKKKQIPSILLDSHFLINAATLKMEPEICVVGAGIKNLFGLLPELDKSIYHNGIDDVLLDLLIAFRPKLTIIDLTQLVIGSRQDGITRRIDGVILGTDPVAVDSFCINLLGLDPLSVPYIKKAYKLGLGQAMIDRIRVCGTQNQIDRLYRLVHEE
jgi:uncharacterized protein (DUF362 family)